MISQGLLQSHESVENERQETGIRIKLEHFLQNLKVQKSIEILKSAVTILCTSNTKLLFLMVLATLPFFLFMVIYEFNVHKLLSDAVSDLLGRTSSIYYYSYDFDYTTKTNWFRNLVPFHLVLSPLMEFFGLTIIINIASQVYAGEQESSSEQVFNLNKMVKGPFITCVLVQLLSTSTLVGLFWTLANHHIVTTGIYYHYMPRDSYIYMLSMGSHALLFVALLYKYLDWSAMWNMGIVISVLEEESGIEALEVSAFFGKHSRATGFQLMLVAFVYSEGVRLPFFTWWSI